MLGAKFEHTFKLIAFGAITFIGSDEDSAVLDAVHERFEVEIKELPEQIDTSSYMPA